MPSQALYSFHPLYFVSHLRSKKKTGKKPITKCNTPW